MLSAQAVVGRPGPLGEQRSRDSVLEALGVTSYGSIENAISPAVVRLVWYLRMEA